MRSVSVFISIALLSFSGCFYATPLSDAERAFKKNRREKENLAAKSKPGSAIGPDQTV
jgi:hypothetical protein